MTTEELDRLEALATKATPGPWKVRVETRTAPDTDCYFVTQDRGGRGIYPEHSVCEVGEWIGVDAPFIAAASPDVVLRLVAELRASAADRACAPRDHEKAASFALATYESAIRTGRIDTNPAIVAGEMAKVLSTAESIASERRDRLTAELSEARAEIERLRAMVPSEEIVSRIRTSVEYDCEDHGCDISEDFWRPVGEWLARIESAKENGR